MLARQQTVAQDAKNVPGMSLEADQDLALPVQENQLLELLPQQESAVLAAHSKVVQLKKGRLLMQSGETVDYVYFPLSGMVSLIAALPEGKSVEVASIGRNGALGANTALGSKLAIAQAIVQVPGLAFRVPGHALATLADESKSLRTLMALYNDALAAQIAQTVACTAFHDAQARFSRYLLNARDCVGSVTLPVTQEMISEALGLRRTTVTFIAGTLRSRGIISYERGTLEIRDEVGLSKLACPCYQSAREFFSHSCSLA